MNDIKDYKYIDIFNENICNGNIYRTQDDIDKFENENQVKLPKDYVDFILRFPSFDHSIDIDKGYGPCKSVTFKNIPITSELGVLSGNIYHLHKELINGKERRIIGVGTTDGDAEVYENFLMILDDEEYGVIYHDKFFDMEMHSMFIKVADNFTELLENVLNGRDLPEDESEEFDSDDEDCEHFTKKEKKYTHEIPYYF